MHSNTYLRLTSLEDAQHLWLQHWCAASKPTPLAIHTLPLHQAHNRTLAIAAAAVVSSPAFHGAAMDGFAVLAQDTFGASEHMPKSLLIGKNAFPINTGHPLPPNTNAVIMVEHVVKDTQHPQGEAISIEAAAFPWQHVRKLGEDMVATEMLLPAGRRIGPYELGALAAAGVTHPHVYERPQVAFIPSGSELRPLDSITPELLASGSVLPEFNSLVISALVAEAGGECTTFPIVPDTPASIAAAIEKAVASEAHLIVINAGSSAGSHDYTASVIKELGEVWVHGVAIMPGKPTILACVQGKPVIGLPGYPVSATLAFEAFGQALLAGWQGKIQAERQQIEAVPVQAIPSKPGMEEFVRVKLGKVHDKIMAVPLPRGAGTVTSLSRADGILRIPAAAEGIPANTPVPVELISTTEQLAGALLAIGSHDNTLDLLDSCLRKQHPRFSLTSAHVGSTAGLLALQKGLCHIAGTHLLDPLTGAYNTTAIQDLLPDLNVEVVRLAAREQGLMLAQGNPLAIQSLADITRPDVIFINRQRGSGTRVLFDWMLQQAHITPQQITGYTNEEYTHMNVAAAVQSGRATVGLGVRAAANALGLAFIPIGFEQYDLVIPSVWWHDPRIRALLTVLQSPSFIESITLLGGYDTSETGNHIWSHHPKTS